MKSNNPSTITPGSDKAIKLGCICPIFDNCHGKGFSSDKEGHPLFYINANCPLHGIKNKERILC